MTDLDDNAPDLEPEAEIVALRLAAGDSHATAAMAIGRSAKWVQRRLATDAEFADRVRALKSARVEQASAGLGVLLEAAIDAVGRNLVAERPADQLQAARLVLDRSRLFRGDAEMAELVVDLQGQIEELRHQLGTISESRSVR